jgi:hypothetical protein
LDLVARHLSAFTVQIAFALGPYIKLMVLIFTSVERNTDESKLSRDKTQFGGGSLFRTDGRTDFLRLSTVVAGTR